MRQVEYAPKAIKDLHHWKTSGNKQVQKKIIDLVEDICKTPFEGIGQPEPLKHQLSGCWSRRITGEHRLIYMVNQETIYILSMHGHYGD